MHTFGWMSEGVCASSVLCMDFSSPSRQRKTALEGPHATGPVLASESLSEPVHQFPFLFLAQPRQRAATARPWLVSPVRLHEEDVGVSLQLRTC